MSYPKKTAYNSSIISEKQPVVKDSPLKKRKIFGTSLIDLSEKVLCLDCGIVTPKLSLTDRTYEHMYVK